MITTILYILLGALMIGAIALAIVSWKKMMERPQQEPQKEYGFYGHVGGKEPDAPKEEEPKKKKEGKPLFIASIVAFVILLGLIITVPASFHQINTGEVAVVRQLGKIVGTRHAGTHFDFHLINKYEIYDAKVQQDKITTAAYSKDGQTMELEVFLQYQVQSENIVEIATQYGSLDALQARIETQTIEKTKAVMSSAEAMTIIKNRASFSNDVSAAVREGISSDYYVNVRDVVLTNIDFTDEFEKSVEDKVIAEQQKQAAITRAEAELEVAKLEAQKKIEEANGNAEAQLILAQASAKAATSKIVELSKSLGYTVTESKDEATGIVTYVINTNSGLGPEKFGTLVEGYLQYLAYLEKWDGKLPEVVSGDGALSIIVPQNN